MFEEVVAGLERRSSEKFTNLLVFLRKRRRWAFSLFKQIRFRPGIHQPLRGILRFNFSYETDFWVNSFVAQKAARCHPFLAVVRCLFHNHLRLKRSSLLNVYLNYKFEFSFLSSHLFFRLFNIENDAIMLLFELIVKLTPDDHQDRMNLANEFDWKKE